MMYRNNAGRLGCRLHLLHHCVLRNTLAESKIVGFMCRNQPVNDASMEAFLRNIIFCHFAVVRSPQHTVEETEEEAYSHPKSKRHQRFRLEGVAVDNLNLHVVVDFTDCGSIISAVGPVLCPGRLQPQTTFHKHDPIHRDFLSRHPNYFKRYVE